MPGVSSAEMDSQTIAGGLAEVRTVINRDNNSGSLGSVRLAELLILQDLLYTVHPYYKPHLKVESGDILNLHQQSKLNLKSPLLVVLFI